jgi:hypothetical protein
MFLLMCSDRHSLQKEQAYSVNTLIFVNTGSFVGHTRLSVAYSGTRYPKISTVMSALGQKRTFGGSATHRSAKQRLVCVPAFSLPLIQPFLLQCRRGPKDPVVGA